MYVFLILGLGVARIRNSNKRYLGDFFSLLRGKGGLGVEGRVFKEHRLLFLGAKGGRDR